MDYYIPITSKELSQRKIEEYDECCKIINWGRENPVRFAERVFGTQLMDFQRYVMMESWSKQFVIWLLSRGASKTTMASIFFMTKLLLIPNYKVFVSTLSASQSFEVFKKLEDIALKREPHFKSLTDIFALETEKTPNNDTGFLHDRASGYSFTLFHGSEYRTLSSNFNALRGKRGSVFYDETAWQSAEQFAATEHFMNVDTSFTTDTNKNSFIDPQEMPLQALYASSAGDVEFPFYQKYHDFSKRMIMGDPNYFVCDLNVNDVMYNSTIDGEKIDSHLKKSQIEKEMRDDPDKAQRELFNKFCKGGGDDSILSMNTVLQNSTSRAPLMYNDTGKKKFIFCYDPARAFDNSVLSIFQVIDDPVKGYYLQLENVVSMVDIDTEKKTPLPMNRQVEIIKELMIKYNGERAADWENIEFYIDAGSGGGGLSAVADELMDDWTDKYGNVHKGIIDPEHKQYETSRDRYKSAIPIVHLLEPKTHKMQMFDALEKMTRLGLVDFPLYDDKEFILIPDKDDFVEYQLSLQEKLALTQCKLMINESIYIVRTILPNGGVRYDLARDKKNIMHDDRAYTLAMGCYALSLMRREDLISKPTVRIEEDFSFPIRAPKIRA